MSRTIAPYSTIKQGVRVVSTSPEWVILILLLASGFSLGAAVANLFVGDWGDALDGGSFATVCYVLASRNRDVNALMGGHR